ncbi:general stress protein [Umezawaea endophytica]|uniref:Glycine zipper family protein n=1 Tax=Umezawaea endophytica TaxID=1654476 RepID=A0A9X2VMA8_9PSEU|nr:general stress protein [Umezawaea endophytica]MCS7479150.1 glycine zipper family protein [Umezawaea endophytica]
MTTYHSSAHARGDTEGDIAPSASQRRTIASFTAYRDAERAVDHLADNEFPVDRTAIIGVDVRMVEQVVGRMNWGRALLNGATAGAVPGLLFGWVFGLFDLLNPLVAAVALALYGLLFGAVIGAVIGVIFYAMQRGRRDFSSVTMMVPSRYDLVVDEEIADEAQRLLAGMTPAGGAS